MSEDSSKKKFKVADNRRFDNSGNERETTVTEVERVLSNDAGTDTGNSKSARAENKQNNTSAAFSENTGKNTDKNTGYETLGGETLGGETLGGETLGGTLSFSSFVISLATQGLMQMGQMQAPEGTGIQKDLEAAKQTIDLLGILDRKTNGNLDDDESKLMEQILHSLRISYVQSISTKPVA